MTTIQCPKCHGTGTATMPAALSQTLDAMRQGELTPEQVRDLVVAKHGVSIGVTGLNMRLERLRKLGLVTKRQGRQDGSGRPVGLYRRVIK